MPALIERRKMTRTTYQALKRHILREREKRKLEQEADLALERQRKEVERRKKLENENKNSLQRTKDELIRLEKQLEDLRKEKSKLFAQLKRILETENTKKVNEKKHETQLYLTGGQSGAPNPAIHFLSGTGHMGRPVMFKHAPHHVLPQPSASVHNTAPPPTTSSVKRRSPSPAPNVGGANVFQFHQSNPAGNIYGGGKYQPPGQESYSPYPHHQPQGSNKSMVKLQSQAAIQKSSSDNYPNRHSIGQVHPHNVADNSRGPQLTAPRRALNPTKGGIVASVASYPMHPANPSLSSSRAPPPPRAVLPGSHNINPLRSQYPRDTRPYY